MSYQLAITQKPRYLHAVVTGRNTRENVAAYLREVLHECLLRRCFRVLIEERLEGPRLRTSDVFQIAARGSDEAAGALDAIAYVDVNAEGDLMHFAETVSLNRGMPIRLFATIEEAEQWIGKRTIDK